MLDPTFPNAAALVIPRYLHVFTLDCFANNQHTEKRYAVGHSRWILNPCGIAVRGFRPCGHYSHMWSPCWISGSCFHRFHPSRNSLSFDGRRSSFLAVTILIRLQSSAQNDHMTSFYRQIHFSSPHTLLISQLGLASIMFCCRAVYIIVGSGAIVFLLIPSST